METLGGFGTGSGARGADGRPAGLRSRVKGVACGGGFTLAVTHGGKVKGAHVIFPFCPRTIRWTSELLYKCFMFPGEGGAGAGAGSGME